MKQKCLKMTVNIVSWSSGGRGERIITIKRVISAGWLHEETSGLILCEFCLFQIEKNT